MVKISFEELDTPASTPADAGPIRLSDAAARRVEAILQNDENKKYLRIGVIGGGCNGFSYSFKLEEAAHDEDERIINENFPNVTVIIDPPSAKLLQGSTVDFVETLEASQFVIKNPNATSSCGCGSSFGV